jgi:hypothetical protein
MLDFKYNKKKIIFIPDIQHANDKCFLISFLLLF